MKHSIKRWLLLIYQYVLVLLCISISYTYVPECLSVILPHTHSFIYPVKDSFLKESRLMGPLYLVT